MTLRRPTQNAFTLIELILVMGVLATLAAIVIPRFSGFLKGQDISMESKRFVALTQSAHNEAISSGLAQTLWINPNNRTYGLRETAGYSELTNSGKIYSLGDNLQFELDSFAARTLGEFAIRFLPDGDIEEGSVTNLAIERLNEERMWIGLNTNGFDFEILGSEDI
ncbi:MAG: pilus assembly FimT family protein [Limisphaerales bacterium]